MSTMMISVSIVPISTYIGHTRGLPRVLDVTELTPHALLADIAEPGQLSSQD